MHERPVALGQHDGHSSPPIRGTDECPVSLRHCRRCGDDKPRGEFYSTGAYCRPCQREHTNAWNKANRERVRAYKRAHYRRRKEKMMEQAEQERPNLGALYDEFERTTGGRPWPATPEEEREAAEACLSQGRRGPA